MPAVSVIIPTYNRASMLGEAIESVLDQTYSDFEIIVVDDGSTDDTQQVVKAFDDTRIRYVFQENRGRSNARNHALSLAQGRYIAFLDSDDLFVPTKLERQVAALDSEPRFGMVYSSAVCSDEQGKELSTCVFRASASGMIYRRVAFYVPLTIILPTVMMRREVVTGVGGFDETMERFEDTDMWRRVARKYPILAMRQPLCTIRTHSGNELASQNLEDIRRALDHYVRKVFAEDQDEGTLFLRRGAARLYAHYGLAMIFLDSGRMASTRRFLIRSIKYWPFQARPYPALVVTYLHWRPLMSALRLLARARSAWLRARHSVDMRRPAENEKTGTADQDRFND